MQEQVLCCREVVGRQLHNKGSGVPCKKLALFEDNAGGYYSKEADEVHQRSHVPFTTHNSTAQKSDNRQLRAAGNKGSGHDGQTTILFVFNSSAGHNTGHTAARRNQQRNEALAAHTKLAEEAVHNEGHASHITTVLQEAQEQEDDGHLRSKADGSANTADNTINNQGNKPVFGACGL